jgi:L-ribulokinase
MRHDSLVLGVDFGTDSVRSVLVDAIDGKELSSALVHYRRWAEGNYCDLGTNLFRQHPLDYIESLEESIGEALAGGPSGSAERVSAISVDTTGSTPVAVDREGIPLSLLPEFSENPNAMFVLWKDHSAVQEAEEINTLARSWGGTDFTQYEGGVYSSEWFWAKILHIIRVDARVRRSAFSWVEHCDWIPALLTGHSDPLTLKRSRCAAGHKAMWHESYGGLPAQEFLTRLDPLLKGLRARLYTATYTSDVAAGTMSEEWARRLGLKGSVVVGVGAFDAHMGAVGGEISPYVLTKIMGTSTCDMIVAPTAEMNGKLVRGICGQVDGSIIPGMLGMEAGQSAFGDVYAWFRDVLMWPLEQFVARSPHLDPDLRERMVRQATESMIDELSRQAADLPIDDSGILALDWMNGRRTPDANQLLKGAITGLNLGSDAPRIFRALVEATAFGARMIVDRFRAEGVRINGVIALGGVPKKSPFIMQIICDVLDMPIRVPRCEQTCALGAGMFAATVAGLHASIQDAMKAMGSGVEKEYRPDRARAERYDRLYARYARLAKYVEHETTLLRRDREPI